MNNVINLSSSDGLDGKNFELLIELNKKILKKKVYIEQNETKLKGKNFNFH